MGSSVRGVLKRAGRLPGRPWLRVLTGIAPVLLALAACGGSASVSSDAPAGTPGATPLPTAPGGPQNVTPGVGDDESRPFIVNVYFTEDGFDPSSIAIPARRTVQIVLRNRTMTERHYRVVGLKPTDVMWTVRPDEGTREEGVSDEDHEAHHIGGFVAFRATSPAGIRPLGDEVHGYAEAGGVEQVRFVALNTGTFRVVDPLHPDVAGQVTVF